MQNKFSIDKLPIRNKISLYAYATYLVVVLSFVVIRCLGAFGVLSFMDETTRMVVSTIFIQIILMFSVTLFAFSALTKTKPKQTLKFFGYKKITKMSWLYIFLLGIIVFFLNSYIASFFSNFLELIGFRSANQPMTSFPWWLFLLHVVFTALLPAICEETAHRGLLLKSSLGFGATRAIIISALLFGLMHMNIQQFFYATIIGLYLGYIAIHSDSIIPCIVIHFMNNFLSTLFTFLSVNHSPIADFVNNLMTINSENMVLGVVFNVTFVAFLCLSLSMLTRKLIAENGEMRVKNLQKSIYTDMVKTEYMKHLEFAKEELEKKESQPQEIQPQEIYINMDDIFFDKNIELGYMTELDKKIIQNDKPYKRDFWSTTFISLCFFVGVAVTIFTLVWGLI